MSSDKKIKPIRKADMEWRPFDLSTSERKSAHKWLVRQAKGDIPKPINNMTLNRYFEIVREAMLALCDENGIYREWCNFSNGAPPNYANMTPRQCAERCMDGRSLFHSDYNDSCGILGNVDPNDPVKFKWWILNACPGGHPWETLFGNFEPYPIWKKGYNFYNVGCYRLNPYDKVKIDRIRYYTDDWLLYFQDCRRCDPFAFRCFIRLRELGLPVIWQHGNDLRWLTKRYVVDHSNEPDWWQLDETFFKGQAI